MSNYNYNNAPPAYATPQVKKYGASDEESTRPLLSPSAGPSAGGFYDQPAPGDIPDDFKARFSTSRYLQLSHLLLQIVWNFSR